MMATRELSRPPHIVPLYLRTVATLLPGASRLPGVPGRGSAMPTLELTLRDAAIEPERLAAYRAVCGYAAGGLVPPTYPHVLAFPLHLALMADSRFPFSAVGLVHVENEIAQAREPGAAEKLTFTVRAGAPEPHPRGQTFAILTRAHAGAELVWSERSTMLRRGAGAERTLPASGGGAPRDAADDEEAARERGAAPARAKWDVPGDIGRRYGAVSGDRNPIHMHALGGKVFGFPRAIAHGMWTKARCLAALEAELPGAFTVAVSFRAPVTIPGSVSFESAHQGETIGFALRSPTRGRLHVAGRVRPGSADLAAEMKGQP
jgi:acyl dehydratase